MRTEYLITWAVLTVVCFLLLPRFLRAEPLVWGVGAVALVLLVGSVNALFQRLGSDR